MRFHPWLGGPRVRATLTWLGTTQAPCCRHTHSFAGACKPAVTALNLRTVKTKLAGQTQCVTMQRPDMGAVPIWRLMLRTSPNLWPLCCEAVCRGMTAAAAAVTQAPGLELASCCKSAQPVCTGHVRTPRSRGAASGCSKAQPKHLPSTAAAYMLLPEQRA